MAAVSTTIMTIAALASVAKTAKDAFSPPKVAKPAPVAPPDTIDRASVLADSARAGVQQRQRKRADLSATTRGGTLLTGGLGVTAPAPVVRKSLLGS